MKLIIGLGNAEPRYDGTRHNTGFTVLDSYARTHELSYKPKTKFLADIAELSRSGEKILFAKPTTYYNESGRAAQAITSYYHIEPQDILIIHDELALPLGTLRCRAGGSDAGNNGIKSITQHTGPDTMRLRIGVTSPARRGTDTDYVLGTFSQEEREVFAQILPEIHAAIDRFIDGHYEATSARVNAE